MRYTGTITEKKDMSKGMEKKDMTKGMEKKSKGMEKKGMGKGIAVAARLHSSQLEVNSVIESVDSCHLIQGTKVSMK